MQISVLLPLNSIKGLMQIHFEHGTTPSCDEESREVSEYEVKAVLFSSSTGEVVATGEKFEVELIC